MKTKDSHSHHPLPITHHLSLLTKKDGFTLIELAMVLIIVGLLIGLGVGLIGPLTRRAKYSETKETLSAAVDSIIGYATSNGKIPSWGDYTADSTIDEFIEVVKDPQDAWTKPLYYFFENSLTSNDSVCNRKTTTLTICRNGTCSVRIPNIAFIVISSSENYNPQTGIVSPSGCPSGDTCIGVYDMDTPNIDNCTTAANCPNYPPGEQRISRTEAYDDIVKWVTLDELRIKAGCTGAQLEIVNKELPYGYQGRAYNATIYADGGVTFISGGDYRWCREESASTGLTFNPSTVSSNCSGLDESSWGQADSLTISGTPTTTGSFSLTFFVRDNNDPTGPDDNIAQKTLVLTINPIVCQGYRVWNNLARRDFYIDGTCKRVNTNAEITTPELLNNGEVIIRYSTSDGSCGGSQTTFSYNQAVSADSNKDCCVNFTGTDRSCP